jgi:DNA-binding CsgD family transcriptional regulator
MMNVTISGPESLLGAALAALVRDLLPGARIDCDPPRPSPAGGSAIVFADSGRWLFVAASAGPTSAAMEALSRGASAVTTLDTPLAEFEFALRSLMDGGPGHVPLDVVRWMAGEALERVHPANIRPALTAREREILKLVARGYTNPEIAAHLQITTNTVRTHLHALSVKFEASNRTRMLANARALAVPEAFDAGDRPLDERASA